MLPLTGILTYEYVRAINGAGKVDVNVGDVLTPDGKGRLDKCRSGRDDMPKFIAKQFVPAGKTRLIKVESTIAEWST